MVFTHSSWSKWKWNNLIKDNKFLIDVIKHYYAQIVFNINLDIVFEINSYMQ